MKRGAIFLVLPLLVCSVLQASAQYGGGGGSGGGPGGGGGSGGIGGPMGPDTTVPGNNSVEFRKPETTAEPEARGEELRMEGRCSEAIPLFRRLAGRGQGYEIARYNLGLCLLELAAKDPDPAHAASLKQEGAQAIVKAANGGFPGAQLRSVSVYLDGEGVASDPVEAGKWSLIYHSNGVRLSLGLPDIPSDLQARLDGALNEKSWADAQARADKWQPLSWSSNAEN